MTSFCKWTVRIAWAYYLVALALLLIGTFGLFGQERDPLSAVFLIPIGVPWVYWIDGLSEPLQPWAAALAPMVNLIILGSLCHLIGKKR